jgi:ParB family chromosome partitioning protein
MGDWGKTMSKGNKFGFEALEIGSTPSRRERSVGPMGAAVREAAENLAETTELKVEQRRKNAEDAKAFRTAQEKGRVLVDLNLSEVLTSDLPRDRLALDEVAQSDEMEELKASIRERGQKEPIEVYIDNEGAYQLKKGWRRCSALKQLLKETGDQRFAVVLARVEAGTEERISRYVDMVEENVVRQDLTFAEMAQLAITAAMDDEISENDAEVMVGRLYGSLHKMKRSYIRSFVHLLLVLGESLKWPKAVSRNLGVDVSRALKAGRVSDSLQEELSRSSGAEKQNRILLAFITAPEKDADKKKGRNASRAKFEFQVGSLKVTARHGECRIVGEDDFAAMPQAALKRAVKAFEEELRRGNPRVTGL